VTLGQEITKSLVNLETILWTMDANHPNTRHEFPIEAVRAASKILMSVLMDRMYTHQEKGNTRFNKKIQAVQYFANELRSIMKQATGIDTHDLYK